MDNVTVYTGWAYSPNFYSEPTQKVYYWLDDRDNFPAETRDYNAIHFGKLLPTDLMARVRDMEAAGHKAVVQVRDMYYETPEE